MNLATGLVLLLLLAAVGLALRAIRRKGPSCGGNCAACRERCDRE